MTIPSDATPPASNAASHDATNDVVATSDKTDAVTNAARLRALNETIRYTMWSVFRTSTPLPEDDAERDRIAADLQSFLDGLAATGVTVRGLYDVAGFRADAEVMVWWHAEEVEALQAAYKGLRRTALGKHLTPVWSQVALHRQAEFNKGHVPAFMADEEPKAYLSVYPFVRSYEWYILPEAERGKMLRDHGLLGRDFPQVISNTVSSFALGDWEWILGLEAPELVDLVDLMRHLRATEARNHVREEIPFYTGRRITPAEVAEVLA